MVSEYTTYLNHNCTDGVGRYALEDVVLSEVYGSDPLSLHYSLSLGVAVAQDRPFWAALYANQMNALHLPPATIRRLVTATAAHQARPWLVYADVLVQPAVDRDPRARALHLTQSWLMREAATLLGGQAYAPVACVASASTRNFRQRGSGGVMAPQRCLRAAMLLGAPARVVYDWDTRALSASVRLLVLDATQCLPLAFMDSIQRWEQEGGRVLASADAGTCDELGRDLPENRTLLSRLGAAATVANIHSRAASALIGGHRWTNATNRILLPRVHGADGHVTVFVLCSSPTNESSAAGGCVGDKGLLALRLPLSMAQRVRGVSRVRLTSETANRTLGHVVGASGVEVSLNTTGVGEGFALVMTFNHADLPNND